MATLIGTTGNDTLIGGRATDDTLIGDLGNDYLDGVEGADTLLGGDGDDTLVYNEDAILLDGGNGNDTLLFNFGASFYNFTGNIVIKGIETIDLTGTGDNALTFSYADVINFSDTDVLRIIGNSGDSINPGANWAYVGSTASGGANYGRYQLNGATIEVNQAVLMTGYSNNATIGSPTVTAVTEDGKLSGGYLQASGSIAVSDLNPGQAGFQTTVGTLSSNLGSLVLAQNGGYTYSVPNAAVQYLGAGQIKTDTFDIKSIDGTAKQVSFNITGVDDAAVFGGKSTGTMTEDSYDTSGRLTINDPDLGQSSFLPVIARSGYGLGTFELWRDGNWEYDLQNSRPYIQALRSGQSTTDYFYAVSFSGASKTLVTVTILGVNDIPVIGGVSSGTVVEDAASPNLSTSGALSIADVDSGESSFVAQTNVAGGNHYGTFAVTKTGAWTYTAVNSQTAIQQLGAGQSVTDYFTARSFDGSASQVVTVTIAGKNDVAVIGGASTGAVVEDASSPNLSAKGALTITDVDAGQSSFVPQTSVAGSNRYGSFTLATDGNWTYSAANSQTAIQQLGAGQSLTDSFTAISSDGSASNVVTVTINGTNDVPVIFGSSYRSVFEDSASPNLVAYGVLTIADVDAGQSSFVAQTNVAGSNRYGSFTLATDGRWTYSAANSQTAVQQLGVGEYIFDYFTARSSDGSTSKVVFVNIIGANDIAVIGGVSTATVAEDASSTNLSAKGALTIADVDAGQSSFVAATNVAGSNHFGTFAVTANGAWTYAASNSQAAVQQLGAGQSLTDSFTARSVDGSASRVVTVTITGTNDVPVIGGVSTATVVEDAASPNLVTSGVLTIADVDAGQSSFVAQTNVAGSNHYGTFAVSPNGAWTYAASNSQTAVQQLGAGQSITDSFTVRSSDGSASKVVTVIIAGTNDVPIIGGVSTASVAEDAGGANLTAKGALVIADVDAGQSSFAAQSNVAGSNHYGTFGIAASGAWTYSAINSQTAIQQLGAGQSITDSFTALSSDGSASRVVTVTITGTNDVPVFGGVGTATVVEDAAGPNLAASGALTIADVDAGQSSFVAQTNVAGSNHYGTFAIGANGAWTYSAANSQTAVQQLGAGQSITDSFTARSIDGSASKVVTVTITGVNDVPTLGGVSSATVAEDAGPNLLASGTLTIADIDAGQSVFKPATVTGSNNYGTFTLVKSGAWTYTAVNSQIAIQQLAAGQSLTDSFTAVSSDGSASRPVTVTITGANDVAVIGGVSSAGVVEDATSPKLSVSGALTISDADAGQSSFTAQAGVAGSNGYGSFTLAANGAWTYTADNSQTVIQQLGANQSLTDSFTARSSDGSALQVVTVSIAGANDQPVISGVSASTVIEDATGPNLSTSGALTIVDPDAGQSSFVAQAGAAGSNGYGSFTLAANGAWTYSASNSQSAIQQLGAGQSLTDSFTAVSSDSVASKVVTVTIVGANDVAVIGGVSTFSVAEDSAIPSLAASGALTIADVDAGQSSFVAQASTVGSHGYGSFTLAANGAWTYSAANNQTAIQQLGADQSITDSFTAVSSDGSAGQVVTVTITGANDAPTIAGVSTATIAEDSATPDLSASGALTIADADTGQSSFVAQASTVGSNGYGSFTLAADGAWTYSAANSQTAIQQLGAGQSITDSFTAFSLDGSAGQAVTVTITGANDAVTIVDAGTTAAISITEIASGAVGENATMHIGTGAIIFADADLSDIHTAISREETSGFLGSFTLAPVNQDSKAVEWQFQVEDIALDSLHAGDILEQHYLVTVADDHGSEVAQTVVVTLVGANDRHTNENPYANPDTAVGLYTDVLKIDVLANDLDFDGDTLVVAGLVDDPVHGHVFFNDDGTLSYIANNGYVGSDSFTYLVTDGYGGSDIGRVDLTLNGPEAPIQPGHDPVGGEVFLRNDYIELGVSGAGSLGTLNNAPANYHPQDGFANIAMVVDLDDWDTGNAPRASDITLPEIGIDTVAFMYNGGNNVLGAMMQLQDFATTTTDVSSSTRVAALTEGLVDGVFPMTQLIELDPGATYFRTTFTLENTTADTLTDVGILRCINPDQDYAYGVTETNNDVLSNPTLSNDVAAIRAYGANSGVAIDLVAFDSDVRVSGFGAMNDNPGIGFAYTNPIDPNGTLTGNSINLTMYFGDLAPGQVVSKVFYTSFNGRSDGHDMCIGTDLDDVIDAKGGNDIIVGLTGNDLLTGGAGNDRFVFNPNAGFDTITDFTPGAPGGDHDVIELRGYGLPLFDQYGYAVTTFDELMGFAGSSGDDTYIQLTPTNGITLKNVAIGQLHAEDFIFG